MKKNICLRILFWVVLLPLAIPAQAQYELIEAYPQLSFLKPVEYIAAKDGTNRIFVVTRFGKIEVFEHSAVVVATNVFLDWTGKTTVTHNEQGLLGLAFHPDYTQNGYFYIYYSRTVSGVWQNVVSRLKVKSDNANQADPASEQVLLFFNKPAGNSFHNHNGGHIMFGQDGFLYIGTGDGGSAGDPNNLAQNRTTLIGKMLRIDVNNTQSGLNYAVPTDNPYKNNSQGFREEIYAYGFRNPWKFSQDKITGKIWVADVGQANKEEINILEKGKNYGWNIIEGTECYNPATNCDKTGLTLPVWQYGVAENIHPRTADPKLNSITGGFVYRGTATPSLVGKFIYADYKSGNIWALAENSGIYTNEFLINYDPEGNIGISTFGEDQQGEIYIVLYAPLNTNPIQTKIYQLKSTVTAIGPSLDNSIIFQPIPNPITEQELTLSVEMPRTATVKLELWDMTGKKAIVLSKSKKLSVGKNQLKYSLAKLPAGIYILQLSTDKIRKTTRIIIE